VVPSHAEILQRDLAAALGEEVTLDGLTGQWHILQRAGGHRHSVDDVLTAAYALRHCPTAPRALDLGTGIGTVGLLVLWGLPAGATLACVEAQEISHRLLLANIALNDLGARVEPRLGDLRDLALDERFPLVTGSPPYFPLGTGVLPDDAQKAHARFELRGDVRDYCLAATRHLAPDGLFAFCFPTPQLARALAAIEAADLALVERQDVIPRMSLAPLFTLFACRPRAAVTEPGTVAAPFVVREADGQVSEAMRAVRRSFGFSTFS